MSSDAPSLLSSFRFVPPRKLESILVIRVCIVSFDYLGIYAVEIRETAAEK